MTHVVDYKYKMGDIINGCIILELIKINKNTTKNGKITVSKVKGYKVKCSNCGYESDMIEYILTKRKECIICGKHSKKVVKGINDVATVRPDLIKYFVNKEDSYSNSIGSHRKILVKCDFCSTEKYTTIRDLSNQGMSCSSCSDGISYGEKFVFNVLKQLNVNFEYQKIFSWSNIKNNTKIYDFYLPDYNTIIEVNGIQHYKNSNRGRTLKEEQENDKFKHNLAIKNNIQYYIELDCRKSKLEYIKNSIINSKLSIMFNLCDVDWDKCNYYGWVNKIQEVCNLWENGIEDKNKLAGLTNLTRATVNRYLNKGKELNLIEYKKYEDYKYEIIDKIEHLWNKGTKNIKDISSILNLDKGMVIKYLKQSNVDYRTKIEIKEIKKEQTLELWNNGIKNTREISKRLGFSKESAIDYLNELSNEKRCDYNAKDMLVMNGNKNRLKTLKSVLCIELHKVFKSITECRKFINNNYNIDCSKISEVCKGNRDDSGGYHFRFVSDLTEEEKQKYGITSKSL